MTTENAYYGVREPFTVEVRIGVEVSNVHIGRTMALQDVYKTVEVRPGDELHLLVGGDFLIRDGKSYAFDTRRHEAYEVMLHPAPKDPPLPYERLERLVAGSKPAAGYREPRIPDEGWQGFRIEVAR